MKIKPLKHWTKQDKVVLGIAAVFLVLVLIPSNPHAPAYTMGIMDSLLVFGLAPFLLFCIWCSGKKLDLDPPKDETED